MSDDDAWGKAIRILSTILLKAQGIQRADTGEIIDIGGDIVAVRLLADEWRDRIATLERENAELKAQTLEKLMREFDAMPEDGEWRGDHPIVQMAQHIDTLRAELRQRVES